MAKVVYVEQDECTGCGLCESSLPDVFKVNDNNVAEVVSPDGASESEIEEIIDSCPVSAIKWK